MISRRRVLAGLAGLGAGSFGLGGYAVAESYGLDVASYSLTPPNWPRDLRLRLAVIADLHAGDPWMSAERIRAIVQTTNALQADAVVMLGDFVLGSRLGRYGTPMPHAVWANELAALKAPLGVHAVLGNHDWWESAEVQDRGSGPTPVGESLQAVGIPVYENEAVRLTKDGHPFWIAGLGDQWAFYGRRFRKPGVRRGMPGYYTGIDDLPKTLAAVTDDAPVILMVHEPDVFPQVPDRVALTLAGHTHGGQIRLFGFAPVVPSRYGSRYAYGHIVEENRHLIVSAGLGCSGAPVRLGAPPEVVVVELGGQPSLV